MMFGGWVVAGVFPSPFIDAGGEATRRGDSMMSPDPIYGVELARWRWNPSRAFPFVGTTFQRGCERKSGVRPSHFFLGGFVSSFAQIHWTLDGIIQPLWPE